MWIREIVGSLEVRVWVYGKSQRRAGGNAATAKDEATGNLVELDQYRPCRRKLEDAREASTH